MRKLYKTDQVAWYVIGSDAEMTIDITVIGSGERMYFDIPPVMLTATITHPEAIQIWTQDVLGWMYDGVRRACYHSVSLNTGILEREVSPVMLDGRLVGIIPSSWTYRKNIRPRDLMARIEYADPEQVSTTSALLISQLNRSACVLQACL